MYAVQARFYDAKNISNEDRQIAEQAFLKSILNQILNVEIIKAIYDDHMAGLNGALEHFESCQSAWDKLEQIGCDAVEKALGYWPDPAAHFEVTFHKCKED